MQSRHLLRAPLLLALPLALALTLTACPKDPSNDPDGGPGDGGVTDTDAGEPDAGPPKCQSDWDDCEATQVCDIMSGECVDGTTCNSSLGPANCNWDTDTNQESPGYGCGGDDAEDCVCAPGANVCKKRRELCEPCQIDEECGGGAHSAYYDRPAACAELDGTNYCLVPAGMSACPQGYLPGPNGDFCIPASGSCEEAFTCEQDADCPTSHPICDREKLICIQQCVFDIETGESTCPTGEICHLDGKCRVPCDPEDNHCNEIDPDYVCKFENAAGAHRCRYEGCIHSLECDVPEGSVYTGFCEIDTHTCITDYCRPSETVADGSNPDCVMPNKCEPLAGEENRGECVPMTCVERGGAVLACGINQFCCGECRDPNREQDNCADDLVKCTGTEPTPENTLEGCFVAPNPPWCQACGEDGECTAARPKEDDRDYNLCMDLCLNTCRTSRDCPTRWSCMSLQIGCDPTAPDSCGAGTCVDDGMYTGVSCTSSGDCNADNNEICAQNPATGQNECHVDGVFRCDCGNNGAPDDTKCPGAGEGGYRCDQAGWQKYRCIASQVCVPNAQAAEACGG